jgi:AcrR family transcriptional regulator
MCAVGESLVGSHPELAPPPSDRPQRTRLLEAMVRAVAEKGYEAATVADAVRLARVSRGTFYDLFTSKEACLLAAYRAGYEVLEERITQAVRDARDWREELRLGFRAYLQTLEQDPLFARVYLIEGHVVAGEREQVLDRFAARYARTFARSGRQVPPREALFVLSVGVHELACARVRRGEGVLDLEPLLVSCAVRLATDKEEPWT